MNYYNDNDSQMTAWMLALIRSGQLPDGIVDRRSITDISPEELYPYEQSHFFAGIGGWALALQLAGWPTNRPVWTGSCPCQPFSQAGRRQGTADPRHLWPSWYGLIRKCRPDTIFGEQVDGTASRAWIDAVRTDLEGIGYIIGVAVLPAAGLGAPHGRHRIYWVAHALRGKCASRHGRYILQTGAKSEERANAAGRCQGHMGDTDGPGLEGGLLDRECLDQVQAGRTSLDAWWALEWLRCADGNYRPTQPGLFPLANGIPARVGRLRGYGNAIVPQVAAEFISAFLDFERESAL